jgi:hypothetical protein
MSDLKITITGSSINIKKFLDSEGLTVPNWLKMEEKEITFYIWSRWVDFSLIRSFGLRVEKIQI